MFNKPSCLWKRVICWTLEVKYYRVSGQWPRPTRSGDQQAGEATQQGDQHVAEADHHMDRCTAIGTFLGGRLKPWLGIAGVDTPGRGLALPGPTSHIIGADQVSLGGNYRVRLDLVRANVQGWGWTLLRWTFKGWDGPFCKGLIDTDVAPAATNYAIAIDDADAVIGLDVEYIHITLM